jgi:hypothetical protein
MSSASLQLGGWALHPLISELLALLARNASHESVLLRKLQHAFADWGSATSAVAKHGLDDVCRLASFARSAQLRQDCARSWRGLGLKDLSQQGYDVVDGRWVDYSNFIYKVLLCFLQGEYPEWRLPVNDLGASWPALQWRHSDTAKSLDRQGDVIEILLALSRGHWDLIDAGCDQRLWSPVQVQSQKHLARSLTGSQICRASRALRTIDEMISFTGLVSWEASRYWKSLDTSGCAAVLFVLNDQLKTH